MEVFLSFWLSFANCFQFPERARGFSSQSAGPSVRFSSWVGMINLWTNWQSEMLFRNYLQRLHVMAERCWKFPCTFGGESKPKKHMEVPYVVIPHLIGWWTSTTASQFRENPLKVTRHRTAEAWRQWWATGRVCQVLDEKTLKNHERRAKSSPHEFHFESNQITVFVGQILYPQTVQTRSR